MSTTIDNRVVELEFDNSKFESNVQTSMSTLDKLKEKLHFKGATKGLEELDSAAQNVNMSGLSTAVETVKVKFSALEAMAVGALMNIGSNAVEAGKRLIKSLSIDQITAGFSKYESKTSSVQTIMNATGKSIDEVSSALDRLNWFTDETSYNFTDMVANVGKFTNNKIDLDRAIDAMQGIATWAAVSGANSQEASRAMYNMSQAIGVGAVKLMDWKSIENANMATAQFKQTVIDTALSLGTLTEESEGMYRTMAGNEVTIENFNENLKDEWFNAEVLMTSLEKYGGFATKLQSATESMGVTASEALGYLEDYKNGVLDINEAASETELSADELKTVLEELASEEFELGNKAFRAAQEAKTFTEAIDATKDAVSTGWMQTFEYIFGNYEEAKTLWTDLANKLYDVFAAGGEKRNELFKAWHDDGGREALIQSLWNTFDSIVTIIDNIKGAFHDIFGELDATKLIKFTNKLKELTEKFKMSDETAEKLRSTFKGIFAIFNIVKEAVAALLSGIKPLFSIFSKLGGGVLGVTGTFGEFLTGLSNMTTETGIFRKIIGGIVSFITGAASKISDAFKNITGISIGDGFSKLGDKLSSAKDKVSDFFSAFKGPKGNDLSDTENGIDGVAAATEKLGGKAKNATSAGSGFKSFLDGLKEVAIKLAPIFSKIADGVGKALSNLGGFLKDFASNLDIDKLLKLAKGGVLVAIGTSVKKFIDSLTKSKNESKGVSSVLKEIGESIKGMFGSLTDTISEFKNSIKASELLKIAIAIGVLSASVIALSKVDPAKLAAALGALTTEMATLMGTMFLFSKIASRYDLSNMKKTATSMLIFSVAVLVLSSALKKISDLNIEEVITGATGIALLAGILVASSKLLSQNTSGLIKGSIGLILFAVAIKALVKPVQELGAMSIGDLAKGLISIALLCAELIIAMKMFSNTGASMKGMLGLLVLAVSLKMIAEPLKSLGNMEWSNIAKGLIAIGGVLLEMSLIAILLGKVSASSILGAITIFAMAIALRMIAEPMMALGQMNWGEIGRSLVAMAGAFVIMGLVAGLLGTFAPTSILGALTMIGMAVALKMIADPMQALGSMDWGEIGRSLTAMSGAFVVMGVVAGLLGVFAPTAVVGALAMIAMAKTLQMIVEPMAALGKMEWGEIGRSLTAMGGAFVIMGTIASGLGVFSLLSIAGAKSLEKVAKALSTAVDPMITLSKMSWSEIGRSILAMTAVLTVLGNALKGFNIFAGIQGEGYKSISEALNNITDPLEKLSKMAWEDIKKSVSAMKVVFESMSEILSDFNFAELFTGTKADSFLKMSEAIKTMAPGITTLSNIEKDKVANVLEVIGNAFKQFSDALTSAPFWGSTSRAEGIGALIENVDSLSESLPAFIALDANSAQNALTVLGDAFKAFANALTAAPFWGSTSRAEGIGALIENVDSLVAVLPSLSDMDATTITEKLNALATGLGSFGAAIKNSPFWGAEERAGAVNLIVNSISTLAAGLKDFLALNADSAQIQNAADNIKNVLSTISSAMSSFTTSEAKLKSFETSLNVLSRTLPGLSTLLPKIQSIDANAITATLNASADAVANFCKTISDQKISFDNFASNATKAADTFATTFSKGIESHSGSISTAFNNIATSGVSSIREAYDSFYSAGSYIVSGLVRGISNMRSAVVTAVANLAAAAKTSFTFSLQIKSPSRVFAQYGEYMDMGLIAGIEKYESKVKKASSSMAESVVQETKNIFSNFEAPHLSDHDMSMTISPILDLTDFETKKSRIADDLSGFISRTTVALANQNYIDIEKRKSLMNSSDNGLERLSRLIDDLINNPPSNNYNEFHISNGNPDDVADSVVKKLQRDIVRRNSVWA